MLLGSACAFGKKIIFSILYWLVLVDNWFCFTVIEMAMAPSPQSSSEADSIGVGFTGIGWVLGNMMIFNSNFPVLFEKRDLGGTNQFWQCWFDYMGKRMVLSPELSMTAWPGSDNLPSFFPSPSYLPQLSLFCVLSFTLGSHLLWAVPDYFKIVRPAV